MNSAQSARADRRPAAHWQPGARAPPAPRPGRCLAALALPPSSASSFEMLTPAGCPARRSRNACYDCHSSPADSATAPPSLLIQHCKHSSQLGRPRCQGRRPAQGGADQRGCLLPATSLQARARRHCCRRCCWPAYGPTLQPAGPEPAARTSSVPPGRSPPSAGAPARDATGVAGCQESVGRAGGAGQAQPTLRCGLQAAFERRGGRTCGMETPAPCLQQTPLSKKNTPTDPCPAGPAQTTWMTVRTMCCQPVSGASSSHCADCRAGREMHARTAKPRQAERDSWAAGEARERVPPVR